MSFIIALVGRPNVGKSTLFNRLTKTQDALVLDMPEVTRDRQYGQGKIGDKPYILIDTGGLYGGLKQKKDSISYATAEQTRLAIQEADCILFLVDAREGRNPLDGDIARDLRKTHKPVFLVINKIDGLETDTVQSDFYRLGFQEPQLISAAHGRGIKKLMESVLSLVPLVPPEADEEEKGIHIAIVGRPNVGKSTFINRVLGQERVVVYDAPGTTRDTIEVLFERQGQRYVLMDTAGVRRQSKIKATVEKFSIIKALQAIEKAHVVVLMVDATQNLAAQDLRLLEFIVNAGKSLVVAINKWDGLEEEVKNQVRSEIDRRLGFLNFADIYFTSALHGTAVGDVFKGINKAYRSAMVHYSTARLTALLEQATHAHAPPTVRGRRIKLRYAHMGGKNPPIIVIHGNQTDSLPVDYQRYLVNFFRKTLKLSGTPIKLMLKTGKNPFEGKKKLLTERQIKKRRRLMKHVKKR